MIRSNPFKSKDALENSNYCSLYKNSLTTHSQTSLVQQAFTATIAQHLQQFLVHQKHSCLIARSTVRSGSCRFGVYNRLGSPEATAGLCHDLITFLEERPGIKHPYASFIAVFSGPRVLSEERFEHLLWQQLQQLHEAQNPYYRWDPSVSSDPNDPKWSFSFGEKGFYVVGMHQNSSRLSRSFPYPMLVFNLHEQFEQMRQSGRYDRVKAAIRRNEIKRQGSINPMLEDFGQSSEAKQYSGRELPQHWKCPFLNQSAP